MADNYTYKDAAGASATAASDDIAGVHYPRVKISQGADGAATDVSSAAPLNVTLANTGANATPVVVDLGANNDVTVTSGSVAVTNAGTFVVQENGAALTALQLIDDTVYTDGSGTVTKGVAILGQDGTNPQAIKTDASGELQVDVLTLPALAAGANNIGDVDVLTVNGVAPAFGSGANGATVQRVTVATDDTNVSAIKTAVELIDNAVSGSGFNITQMNGVNVTMGNGASGTGVQRVTLASDSTGVVGLSTGTNTIGAVNVKPATSGGLTTYHLVSAATTNATNIKASAGQVFGWYIYNSNAAARKVVFHNTSGTPTAGASVYFSLMIPPTSGANVEFTNGIAFSTGIGITTVTGLADSDSAAVAANDLIINIWYA